MLRITAFVLVALGCSKTKDKATPPPPPVVADAAEAAPADAAAAAAADAGAAASGDDAGAAAAPSGDAGVAVASSFDFEKLSREDKIKFMKQKVMPKMKPLFQKFDAKEFANFNCKTCHGKDLQKRKYEMPTPDLPPLDFDAIKAGKEDPKMVEFMSKTVKPEMAKLLAMPEMSDTQPKGFGCLFCHTMKKKK